MHHECQLISSFRICIRHVGRYVARGKLDSKGFQEFGKIGLTNTLGTLFLVTLGTNTVDIQK